MQYYFYVDTIRICIDTQIMELTDFLSKQFPLLKADNNIESDRMHLYTISICLNEKMDSVSMKCYFDKEHLVYEDNMPLSLCYTVLVNQVLPLIISKEQGYLLFHASGFVMNGRLILFTGKSGSGKTTLTLKALLNCDVAYFSDDFTIYNVHTQRFIPFTRMFHIKSGTEKYLQLDGRNKEIYTKTDDLEIQTTYKIFYPDEFCVPIQIYDNIFSGNDVVFCAVQYLGADSRSQHEYIKQVTQEFGCFRMLLENCLNVKEKTVDLLNGYKQIRNYAKFYSAQFRDDEILLNSLFDCSL